MALLGTRHRHSRRRKAADLAHLRPGLRRVLLGAPPPPHAPAVAVHKVRQRLAGATAPRGQILEVNLQGKCMERCAYYTAVLAPNLLPPGV